MPSISSCSKAFPNWACCWRSPAKNDPDVVEEVLVRPDLRPYRDCFFPIEVGLHDKSEAVSRILKRWNIAADAVAFIDDSPLELAEVQAQHPELHCYLYPKDEAGLLGRWFTPNLMIPFSV
jgi:predicted enzyme involved in methoxymalonyl-ACP biosynthesis